MARGISTSKTPGPPLILRAWRFFKLRFRYHAGRSARTFRQPRIPCNPDGKVLIHIGCGEFNDPRYINVDKRKMGHVHIIGSVEDLSSIPGSYADLIYMSHILEHVSHRKVPGVLIELRKRLKNSGILRIAVPDFDKLVEVFQNAGTIESVVNPLMGGQGYPENYHYSIFTSEYLTKLLLKAGFKSVRAWDSYNAEFHSFNDWSKKPHVINGKEYFLSLNLEAIK